MGRLPTVFRGRIVRERRRARVGVAALAVVSIVAALLGVLLTSVPGKRHDTSAARTRVGPYREGSWPGAAWVPYATTSPWNTPLPAYGTTRLVPDSTAEIGYMATHWSARFTPLQVSNNPIQDEPSRWGHPLYWAKASDPTYTIVDSRYACGAPYASSCPRTVQIPDGAQHALAHDGQLAVIQPDGHTEVDFWKVQNANPLAGGGTITVHDYGALDLNGSGCCGGSTAADQGLPAGAIRGPELAAGAIKHALSGSEECSNGGYVPPATGAGAGGCPGAPPVGARLQLKMSDSQIALWFPVYQRIILTAMAHYGIYITDTGGAPMDLDYEPAIMYTSFGNTSNTVMSFLQTQGYSEPAEITISLPWTDFQIASTCYATRSC